MKESSGKNYSRFISSVSIKYNRQPTESAESTVFCFSQNLNNLHFQSIAGTRERMVVGYFTSLCHMLLSSHKYEKINKRSNLLMFKIEREKKCIMVQKN